MWNGFRILNEVLHFYHVPEWSVVFSLFVDFHGDVEWFPYIEWGSPYLSCSRMECGILHLYQFVVVVVVLVVVPLVLRLVLVESLVVVKLVGLNGVVMPELMVDLCCSSDFGGV